MLQVRSIAVSAAVLGFFMVAVVGSLYGLAPSTCCRRAVLGAAIAYLVVGICVRAINAILTQAMIESQIQRGNTGDNQG